MELLKHQPDAPCPASRTTHIRLPPEKDDTARLHIIIPIIAIRGKRHMRKINDLGKFNFINNHLHFNRIIFKILFWL